GSPRRATAPVRAPQSAKLAPRRGVAGDSSAASRRAGRPWPSHPHAFDGLVVRFRSSGTLVELSGYRRCLKNPLISMGWEGLRSPPPPVAVAGSPVAAGAIVVIGRAEIGGGLDHDRRRPGNRRRRRA